jgi:hypothetical protein
MTPIQEGSPALTFGCAKKRPNRPKPGLDIARACADPSEPDGLQGAIRFAPPGTPYV